MMPIRTILGLWKERRLLGRKGNRCNSVQYSSGPENNRECQGMTQEQLTTKHKALTDKKENLIERMEKLKAATKLEKEWETYKQQFIDEFKRQEYQYQQSMGGCRQFHQQRLESIVQNYERRIAEREPPATQKETQNTNVETPLPTANGVETLGNNTWAVTISPNATLQLHFKNYVQSTDLLPQMTSLQTQDYFVRRDPQNRNRIIISSQNAFTYKAINGFTVHGTEEKKPVAPPQSVPQPSERTATNTVEPTPVPEKELPKVAVPEPRKPARTKIERTPTQPETPQRQPKPSPAPLTEPIPDIPLPEAENPQPELHSSEDTVIRKKTTPTPATPHDVAGEPPANAMTEPTPIAEEQLPQMQTVTRSEYKRMKIHRKPTEEKPQERQPSPPSTPLEVPTPNIPLPKAENPQPELRRPEENTQAPTPPIREIQETVIPPLPSSVTATLNQKTGMVTLSIPNYPDVTLNPAIKNGITIPVSPETIRHEAEIMKEKWTEKTSIQLLLDLMPSYIPDIDPNISFLIGKDNRITVKYTTPENKNNPTSLPITPKRDSEGYWSKETIATLIQSTQWLIKGQIQKERIQVSINTTIPKPLPYGVKAEKSIDQKKLGEVTIAIEGAKTRVLEPTYVTENGTRTWTPVSEGQIQAAITEMFEERRPKLEDKQYSEEENEEYYKFSESTYEFNPQNAQQTYAERQERKNIILDMALTRTEALFGPLHPYNKESTMFNGTLIAKAVREKLERKLENDGKTDISSSLQSYMENYLQDLYYASLAVGAHSEKIPKKPTTFLIEDYIRNEKFAIGGNGGEFKFSQIKGQEFHTVDFTIGLSENGYRDFPELFKTSLMGMLAEYNFKGWNDASSYPDRAKEIQEIFRKNSRTLVGRENTRLVQWMMHRLREASTSDGYITEAEWKTALQELDTQAKAGETPLTQKLKNDYESGWKPKWEKAVERPALPPKILALEGTRRRSIDEYRIFLSSFNEFSYARKGKQFVHEDFNALKEQHIQRVQEAHTAEIAEITTSCPDALIYSRNENPYSVKLLDFLIEQKKLYT